jgi:hypothetical protein
MNLAVVCLIDFVMVMSLLWVLAATIRLLTHFFPDRPAHPIPVIDSATVSAIQTAVSQHFAGARLVKVEHDTSK